MPCGILVINLSSNRDRFDNGVYGQGYRSQCEATRNYSRGRWKLWRTSPSKNYTLYHKEKLESYFLLNLWKIYFELTCLTYFCFRSLAFHLPRAFGVINVTRDTKDNSFFISMPQKSRLYLLYNCEFFFILFAKVYRYKSQNKKLSFVEWQILYIMYLRYKISLPLGPKHLPFHWFYAENRNEKKIINLYLFKFLT